MYEAAVAAAVTASTEAKTVNDVFFTQQMSKNCKTFSRESGRKINDDAKLKV